MAAPITVAPITSLGLGGYTPQQSANVSNLLRAALPAPQTAAAATATPAQMLGLLNLNNRNPLAQGLLAAGKALTDYGAPSTMPKGGFMGALGAGGQGFVTGMQSARDANLQNRLLASKFAMDMAKSGQVIGSAETGFSIVNPVTGQNTPVMSGVGRQPKTVEVDGYRYILNSDATLGRNLGLSERYVSVPGVGVVDVTTGELVKPGDSSTPSGSSSPPALPTATPPTTGSPTVDAKIVEQSVISGQETIDAFGKRLNVLNDIVVGADRFEVLMDSVETGGIARQVPGARMVEGAFDSAVNEMQTITDKLTPLLRQGLPGAASDRDVAMFRGGVFSVDKKPETNKALILGFRAAKENLLARKSFLEGYLAQNNTLAGADASWNKYLTDNPIFDPTVDEMRLNPNRKNYEEYFAGGPESVDFVVRKKR